MVHIAHGVNEGLTWPVIQMRVGTGPRRRRRLLPGGARAGLPLAHVRRRRWSTLARELGVRMVVGLGAFPAPAPHTRPVRLAATAPPSSADLVAEVGIVQGEIDVPSGVWGALELAFGEAGSPPSGCGPGSRTTCRAWRSPPPAPPCSTAWRRWPDLSVDSTDLHTAADASLRQVDDLIAKSAEHTAMVRQLERSVDAAEGNPLDVGTLPTGDELAAELERYLRDERSDGSPPDDV